jgi:hypothetical protein
VPGDGQHEVTQRERGADHGIVLRKGDERAHRSPPHAASQWVVMQASTAWIAAQAAGSIGLPLAMQFSVIAVQHGPAMHSAHGPSPGSVVQIAAARLPID